MIYSNFYTNFWYIPQSERDSVRPARFLIQSPSFKLYTLIAMSYAADGIIPEFIDHLLLDHCVIAYENVDGLDKPSDLPLEIQQDLLQKLMELFYPDFEFYNKLELSLDLFMDSKLQGETWSCQKCQERKLDRQRNCPYLDKAEYHEDGYRLTVGDEVYTECPIPLKDNLLVGKVMEAHKIAESNQLPEDGAYGNQPVFWAITSQKMKDKLNQYERKQMEEERAKLKR